MTNLRLLLLIGLTAAFVAGNAVDYPMQNLTTPKPPVPPPTTIPTTLPPPPPPTKPTDPPTKPPTKPTDPTTKPPTKPTDPTTKPPTKPTDPPTKPPITTTTKPITTAAPPKPPKPVDPEPGVWQVTKANNNTVACLLVKFALQIQIPYHYQSNKTTELAFLDIPKTASSVGICANETEYITLEWKQNVADNFSQSINISFSKNLTSHKYYLQQIDVKVLPDNSAFPGISDDDKNKTIELTYKHQDFVTSLSKSYKCDKIQTLNLTDVADNKPRGEIHISHVQFQAFEDSKNKVFTDIEDCEPVDTPDVVPIAVGCALAVLVIVVLVAYLIGRRRRQARGYLSMFAGTKRESDYIPMKHLSCFQ